MVLDLHLVLEVGQLQLQQKNTAHPKRCQTGSYLMTTVRFLSHASASIINFGLLGVVRLDERSHSLPFQKAIPVRLHASHQVLYLYLEIASLVYFLYMAMPFTSKRGDIQYQDLLRLEIVLKLDSRKLIIRACTNYMCSVFISWLDLQDATIKMCRLAGYTWRVFAQSIYGYVGTLQYVEIVVAARKYIKL
jgi:hypothetical protein